MLLLLLVLLLMLLLLLLPLLFVVVVVVVVVVFLAEAPLFRRFVVVERKDDAMNVDVAVMSKTTETKNDKATETKNTSASSQTSNAAKRKRDPGEDRSYQEPDAKNALQKCSECKQEKPEQCYAKRNWKRTNVKCNDCVEADKKRRSDKARCSQCQKEKEKKQFSEKQLHLGDLKKCKSCLNSW